MEEQTMNYNGNNKYMKNEALNKSSQKQRRKRDRRSSLANVSISSTLELRHLDTSPTFILIHRFLTKLSAVLTRVYNFN